jgi:predicted DNA-binding transcriptional regulator AlpA
MPWLSPSSAAAYADVSKRVIYRWFEQGLRHRRITARMVRTRAEWVDEWIESQSVTIDVNKILEGIEL